MSDFSPRVLLVSMPWASTLRPSLGVGILVAQSRRAGFACEATFPNLTFSAAVGSDVYEGFAQSTHLFPIAEHLFATDLFGREALDSDAYLEWLPNATGFRNVRDHIIPKFLDECARELVAQCPTMIGFSCTFNQILPSLAAARRVKLANPRVITLLGGACVHGSMGEAYARAFPDLIDHVFTGEADHTFVEFLKTRRKGGDVRAIPGLTTHGRLGAPATPVTDLDGIATPDYSDYFRERTACQYRGLKLAEYTYMPFESSRGCWWGQKHHCTFCGLNNEGMAYRSKSSDRIINEMVELGENYGSVSLWATDNILDAKGYADLLPKIASLPIDFDLFYEIKANVRKEDVAALASAGVRNVQPGIESFSDNVLRLMRKGIRGIQNVQAIKWFAEYGIDISYNILVGFPGERDDDYEEMIRLLPLLYHLPPPLAPADIVQVHRFSPFHRDPSKYGIQGLRPPSYARHLIPPKVLTGEEFSYWFERDIPPDAPVHRHLGRLNQLIGKWLEGGVKRVIKLGAGIVQISDGVLGQNRTETLDRIASLLVVLTDKLTALTTLAETVTTRGVTLAEMEHALGQLQKTGRIVVQQSVALSLTPFNRPHSPQDLSLWLERFWPTHHKPTATPTSVALPMCEANAARNCQEGCGS
jgi:ribosomal peptide maturation radical SAM protein 1